MSTLKPGDTAASLAREAFGIRSDLHEARKRVAAAPGPSLDELSEKLGGWPTPEVSGEVKLPAPSDPDRIGPLKTAYTAADMQAHGDARAAVERERCAQAAWRHFMDTCQTMRVSPASMDKFCAAGSIRKGDK